MAMVWLKYCRRSVNLYPFIQSFNKHDKVTGTRINYLIYDFGLVDECFTCTTPVGIIGKLKRAGPGRKATTIRRLLRIVPPKS